MIMENAACDPTIFRSSSKHKESYCSAYNFPVNSSEKASKSGAGNPLLVKTSDFK